MSDDRPERGRIKQAAQPLKRVPGFYRTYQEARSAAYALRNLLPGVALRALRSSDGAPRQSVQAFPVSARASTPADVVEVLRSSGLTWDEGKHTYYLPPQEGLSDVLGSWVERYPPDAGFKLVRRLGGVGSNPYLIDAERRRVHTRIVGGIADLHRSAASLYAVGLGPRPFDVVDLELSGGTAACHVVEHVSGRPTTEREHASFILSLRAALGGELVGAVKPASPNALTTPDLAPPDCGGNLIRSENGRLLYIDPQPFVLLDARRIVDRISSHASTTLHFGGTRRHRGGGAYPYQSVPGIRGGKRDTARRWRAIDHLLATSGSTVRDRVVLDLGCNAGMMLGAALASGARWGLGWDRPEVADVADRIQVLLGNTRTAFVGAELDQDHPYGEDVPTWIEPQLDGCVVLFLSVWRHVGIPRALADLPWRAAVVEGHQEDTEGRFGQVLAEAGRRWGAEVAVHGRIRDGDSAARPMAVLTRPGLR